MYKIKIDFTKQDIQNSNLYMKEKVYSSFIHGCTLNQLIECIGWWHSLSYIGYLHPELSKNLIIDSLNELYSEKYSMFKYLLIEYHNGKVLFEEILPYHKIINKTLYEHWDNSELLALYDCYYAYFNDSKNLYSPFSSIFYHNRKMLKNKELFTQDNFKNMLIKYC